MTSWQGFFQVFARGEQISICVQSVWQTRGIRGHVSPGNFDFGNLLDPIWWNLELLHNFRVPSGTHNQERVFLQTSFPGLEQG